MQTSLYRFKLKYSLNIKGSNMRLTPIGLLAFVSMMACAQGTENKIQQDKLVDSLNFNWLDTSVTPQQDFYQYANGAWKVQNPIPPEYSSWGSFSVLEEKNVKAVHEMLMEITKEPEHTPGSIEQKIADFYDSGMDELSINALGISPLQAEFALISNIQTQADLQAEITHLHLYGIGCGFNFGSMQDFKDSTKMIGAFVQGGLSLPDRDYYLKTDKQFETIRSAFLKHMSVMFQLAGDSADAAEQSAQTVMRIETVLAQGSMSQIAQRDPYAVYNLMTIDKLKELSPGFGWSQYLKAMGQESLLHVNVAMPEFIKTFDEALKRFSIEDWKIYLRWHLLDSVAAYISKPFVDENFKMNAILSGAKTLPPRWKQVVSSESGVLGFAIGELYVKRHFSPAAKQEVIDMIDHIRNVLRHDLKHLKWMTKATRQQAIKKLDMIEERVGYPDKWWDYTSLNIDKGPYILNILRGTAFLVQRDLHKIGKPVDRTEWAMTPQTVNAYYDPSMNSINIPMGILQVPYFDLSAPMAVNYGGIGVVIGHEITHGFDDQGSQFDGYGNLHNWWTDEDLKKFKAATLCIINQYSQYKVNGTSSVQGPLVVGEATADLGGLILAYRAFHAAENYKEQPIINGLTPDQQFFLSFAHIWANNIRPERAQNMVLVDPHPPAQYRVNGTLANCPIFKRDFHVPDDSIMVNPNPCVIW